MNANLIAEEIQALSRHYPRTNRNVEDEHRWLRDYCADLAPFPPAIVSEACRRWRQNPAEKRFPFPGQLIALCRSLQERREQKARPVEAGARPYEPWNLSAGEVADLSLTEAIRNHRAMAQHCRQKAGPMWRGGAPAKPEDLPQRWHTWTAEAAHHESQAATLQKRLETARV